MPKTKKRITLGEVDFEVFKVYLESVVGDIVEKKLEEKGVVTRDDIKHLPTKHEFYMRMDKLSKEIEDDRHEKVVEKEQVSTFNERITVLEDIHPEGQHSTS